MIKIKQIDNVTHVSAAVTDFADSLGYCEYKIPLTIQGIKAKPTKSLLMGSKAHIAEEEYEQETVEFEPVTADELIDETVDLEFPREDIYSRLMIPFEFEKQAVVVSLNGRIDKMKRVGGTLIIQDDKFVSKPEKYLIFDGLARKIASNFSSNILSFIKSCLTKLIFLTLCFSPFFLATLKAGSDISVNDMLSTSISSDAVIPMQPEPDPTSSIESMAPNFIIFSIIISLSGLGIKTSELTIKSLP